MGEKDSADLAIGVLGDFTLRHGCKDVAPPASQNTRALLAYPAVTGRPRRRERLCESFWEVPDGPKGALRLGLSKLRSSAGDKGKDIPDTDRNTVLLMLGSYTLDSADLLSSMARSTDQLPTEQLEAMARSLRGGFLKDLSMHSVDAICRDG